MLKLAHKNLIKVNNAMKDVYNEALAFKKTSVLLMLKS